MSDLATVGGIVSAGVTLGGVVFHLGGLSARVKALEAWRGNIRTDFHEVDEKIDGVDKKIGTIVAEIGTLRTVVEERTERRSAVRVPISG